MKQTAVEWLVKQLNINGTVIPMEIESKAKEMEKEQSRSRDEIFEQAKETQKLTMINALVEFSKAHFDIHTEEAILNITRRAEKYYNETFKQQEQ